jgi:hypothetical protein
MIVLDSDATGAQTEKHQKRMMGEIASSSAPTRGTGWLDPAACDRTVQILLSGKSAPVIRKAPEGAWTLDVFNKAATINSRPSRSGDGKETRARSLGVDQTPSSRAIPYDASVHSP